MITDVKLNEWIELYHGYIAKVGIEYHVSKEEGYKFQSVDTFQKYFNIDAPNLAENIELAIPSNNLVGGNMYWPKKMLWHFASESENETRSALKLLFDEDLPVADRIDQCQTVFDKLIIERNKRLGESANSFISLRFLSLLLGFQYPDIYPAIKPREWKLFCKFVDDDFKMPNGYSSGKKYEVFRTYISALNEKIRVIPEIQKIRDALVRGLEFSDSNFNWMTQDVIYVVARTIATSKDATAATPAQLPDVAQQQDVIESELGQALQFPLETYLENFLVRNWDQINFGEKLTLYTDEDSSPPQQYPTSEGFIDILARDDEGNFVVIELKRGRSKQEVLGQILAYIGWVKKNLATNNQKVRGIIIVSDANKSLLDAVSTVQDLVSIKYYRLDFSFVDPEV